MRKLIIPFSCGIFLLACSKQVPVKEDFPGAEKYSMLYMPQAVNGPVATAVNITAVPDTITFNACIGGLKRPAAEIPVTFTVTPEAAAAFNLANGTQYPVMPEGSYAILTPSASIPAGQSTSGQQQMELRTKGFIAPFVTYLLPVTLSQPGKTSTVNPALSVSYFLVTGGYAPGEVPREKVAAFGTAGGSFLISFGERFIRKDPASGNLLMYTPDAQTGQFTAAPVTIGYGWDIFNTIIFYGGNRLIARYGTGAGDLAQYPIDAQGQIGSGRTVGWGWSGLKSITPYKGLLLGIDGNGKMTKFPLDENGNFDFGNIRDIGTGWESAVDLFPYENSLMVLEPNGNMWQYPLSEDGSFGNRRLAGTGWDMYVKVIPAGTDLLALDANGDLWRYKFNPAGLWALKKP
ncbi:BT_3987 domain-containing protein [Chitinophaga sp. 22620]|uniref:BT_3987 domain-containing protein n=1 Tax=Chitinophaga sp. 22620 TaxID=3453952 RepID=UPI003F84B6BC